jgi:fatty acid desaturase
MKYSTNIFLPNALYLVLAFLYFSTSTPLIPHMLKQVRTGHSKNSGLLDSSFIQVPRVLSFFTDGIEYHHIHHNNSKIPGYNLHKYHDEVVATSTAFDNITKLTLTYCFNNIWLMMYDEERKKYITMTEAYAIAKTKNSIKASNSL